MSTHHRLTALLHAVTKRLAQLDADVFPALTVKQANRRVNGAQEQLQARMAKSDERGPGHHRLDGFRELIIVESVWESHM